MNLNSPHLATGADCPPLIPGSLRIYSMRFCPYAHRALLAASAKGIKYDVVNINLVKKPEFIFSRNPDGKVPTIETNDGKVLYESLIVADFIDEEYNSPTPGGGDCTTRMLNSTDPYQRALDRIWIEKWGKISSLEFQISSLLELDSSEAHLAIEQLFKELGIFEAELKRRGTKYFSGDVNPGMLDYMIWPWVERFPSSEQLHPKSAQIFKGGRASLPALMDWEKAMLSDEAVKESYLSPENYTQYRYMRRAGGNIDYDFLLVK